MFVLPIALGKHYSFCNNYKFLSCSDSTKMQKWQQKKKEKKINNTKYYLPVTQIKVDWMKVMLLILKLKNW